MIFFLANRAFSHAFATGSVPTSFTLCRSRLNGARKAAELYLIESLSHGTVNRILLQKAASIFATP